MRHSKRELGAVTLTLLFAASATLAEDPSPPAAEPGGPPCAVPTDCIDDWLGADCVAGTCYVPKNRYLSIDPTINATPVAYEVELTTSDLFPEDVGTTWWLTDPQCIESEFGTPVPPPNPECEGDGYLGWVSRLTSASAPAPRAWTESPLHITGCVVPVATYDIRATDGGGLYSDPLEINTIHKPGWRSWGDVAGDLGVTRWRPPDGEVNFGDVGAVIRAMDADPFAPPLVWADLGPAVPNGVVDNEDYDLVVGAFEDQPYPYTLQGCDASDCQGNGIRDDCDLHCGPSEGECDVPGCGESEDCTGNGVPDECESDCQPEGASGHGTADSCDVWHATSNDCNGNLVPDECEPGPCCFEAEGIQSCALSNKAVCEGPEVNGIWRGACAECPEQNAGLVVEPGGAIFIHIIGPPVDCPPGPGEKRARPRDCGSGPFTDPWESPADGAMCQSFDPADGAPPIPADFFDPGSDPFEGLICLEGTPLGNPDFPLADTLIERASDPSDPCAIIPLPADADPIDIEILQLSLVNRDGEAVVVTYNGGQNPEDWDVSVARSDTSIPPDPKGTLQATKTHCNGGTYVSQLRVWAEFTFVRRADGAERIFTPDDYLTLTQTDPAPWVHYVDPNLGADEDLCSYFHAGIEDDDPQPTCADCNGNLLSDSCDIEGGASADCQLNGVPDECELSSGTSVDVNGNSIPDECETAPAPEPGGPPCSVRADCTGAYEGADCVAGVCYVPKNRYVSIDPTTNPGPVAYQVELTEAEMYPTALGRTWWVGVPACLDAVNGIPVDPPPNPQCWGSGLFAWVAELESTPVTRVWNETSIHITGCGVVPVATYWIQASANGGVDFSPPLEVGTAHNPEGETQSWGDITGGPVPGMLGLWLPPERATNLADVQYAIRTFENRSEATGFPPRVWVDVEINQVINLGDVQFIIDAFEGKAYADLQLPLIGIDPSDCP